MAAMHSQAATDDVWTETDTTRVIRGLSRSQLAAQELRADPAVHRHDVLVRTMQEEVIPRLLRARLAAAPASVAEAAPAPALAPVQEQVSRLVGLVLEGGQAEPAAYVETLRQAGAPVESLLLDLLTPAARLLGEMWEDDTCSFSDVTRGMLRLGQIQRLLDRAFSGDVVPAASAPRALLVQMPGEQHGFGLAMVTQFFRRAGWNVRQEPVVTSAGLQDLVRTQAFGLVGISLSCSSNMAGLEAEIRAIRRHSRNAAVAIMVGGPPFIAHPQLAAMVGADATAADGKDAVRQAESLVAAAR